MYGVTTLILLLILGAVLVCFCVGLGVIILWLGRRMRRRPAPSGAPAENSALAPAADGFDAPSVTAASDPESFLSSSTPGPVPETSSSFTGADMSQFPTSLPSIPPSRPAHSSPMTSPLVFRFGLVAVIALVLLIPLVLVENIVDERAGLYRSVVNQIGQTWGGRQEMYGPVLVIPYVERRLYTRTEGEGDNKRSVEDSRLVTDHLVLLPAEAEFQSGMEPQERQRGIYRSLVYAADVTMRGRFELPEADALDRLAPARVSIDFDKAFVVVGLSWTNALRTADPFMWNGQALTPEPGTQPFTSLDSGYRVPVRLSPATRSYTYSQHVSFNGSQGLNFVPVGDVTTIALASPWPHPSFQGSVLPVEHEVRPDGFTASWHVPSLARSFPGLSTLDDWPFPAFTVGVDLYESGTQYHLVGRAVKYGALFIAVTFLAFLVLEMGWGARLHPVQYGVVGLSMVVFYLVLLSLSEHLGFGLSYAAASACTVLMIALYAGTALRSLRQGLGAGVLLTALYSLLYTILQMEDYALLMGTALILVMLAALMVVTRHLTDHGAREDGPLVRADGAA